MHTAPGTLRWPSHFGRQCFRSIWIQPFETSGSTLTDAVVPLQHPIEGKSGRTYNSVHIPANTDVCVGIIGANKDKAIWGADADEWKPSRWLSELPERVQDLPGIYSNMLTFGTGPRSCIGLKFAELEMSAYLICLDVDIFH